MKNCKMNIVKKQIIQILLENDFLSVSTIAKLLNQSEKNVRNKIEDINVSLTKSNMGQIIKLPGKGVSLVIDSKNENQLLNLFGTYEYEDIINSEYRLYIYLRILLGTRNNRLTLSSLSELTYDSIPVCKKNIAMCSQWLKMFSIEIAIKRNFGIDIIGLEENIRLAIKHLVVNDKASSIDSNISFFAKGINLQLLRNCVEDIENSWNFSFTEESYNSILLFAALAITRGDLGLLHLNDQEKDIVVKYNEYNLSQSLFSLIEERFMTTIDEDEIKYFAVQLLCSQMIHNESVDLEFGVRDYDKKIKEFVNKIISVISNIMNVDMTIDNELYFGLLNHIRPAVFRMKFEKHSTANLTNFIQEEYRKTYRVSWALSVLFEEYYSIQISSTELSYITLYIQASLDRLEPPFSILLVTELGMGLNQMFCNKIKLTIPKIKEIKIMSLHDLNYNDCRSFDLIVTTSQLDFKDNRIVHIESLLSSHGIDKLKEKIDFLKSVKMDHKSRFHVSCHTLFEPNLIIIKPNVSNKSELIKLMTECLLEYGYVNERYYSSVMEREQSVSTYIGNKVAIPHGNSNFVNQSKVVVATLEKPIKWNDEDEVYIVFLLGLQINSSYESEKTQLFYKSFLEMIDTDEDVSDICLRNQEELYKYLVR